MAAVPNILDSIEHDPKVKLLVAFLKQVFNVERKDIQELLLVEAQMMSYSQLQIYWNASVTLGNRRLQVDILISNLRDAYSVESVTFRGGWRE